MAVNAAHFGLKKLLHVFVCFKSPLSSPGTFLHHLSGHLSIDKEEAIDPAGFSRAAGKLLGADVFETHPLL